VNFTAKARNETAAVGLQQEDVRDILASLGRGERVERLRSERNGEWLYVFRPRVGPGPLYLKVVLRNGCTLISCHEDADEAAPEATDGG
jgi:hypothetical protein